jgi:hypothetical protein
VERERKPDESVDSENKNNPGDDISSLWNEELKESYRTLTGLIRGLDADTRQEILEVLELIGKFTFPKM